jgi:flavin reductase (DIM6/NTAB) family NADH-FMN oxidoreductase RutF
MKIELNSWYKVLSPRTTVIVATRNIEGISNAAPFSFVMPVSMDPPLIAFASAPKRHTLANIRAAKDFTINIPDKNLLKQTFACAEKLDEGISEIEKSNLNEIEISGIKSPGIKECFAVFGCKFLKEYPAGDHIIVIGEITEAHIKDELFINREFDPQKAEPLLHIGGKKFSIPGKTIVV